MKRKIVKISVMAILMLCIAIISLTAIYYYKGIKDYKNTLSVDQTSNNYAGQRYDTQDDSQNYTKETETVSPDINENEENLLKKKDIINILFLGIDKTEERDEWLRIYRTDTIALLAVNLDTKKVNVLSIPRDTYTYLPDVDKMDKINHAYAFGGMKENGINETIKAVNKFVKYSSVDYYFTLDMEPIPQIVDLLGGIELDVEIDMKTHGVDLSAGKQLLNGEQAFNYIYWRYSGRGDIDRIFRQQKFLKAMADKLKKGDQLLNAVKIVLDYKKNIQTDMTNRQMLALANLMRQVDSEDVTFYNIPGSGKYIKGISYWIPDEKETDEVLKNFNLTF